jgi:hypothetical protein
MISVPLNHAGQIGKVRGGSPFRAVVAIAVAQMPILVHHQHPEPITRVQQRHAGRVMRRPPGIAPHLLKLPDPPGLEAVGHGNSHAGKILMAGSAFDLDMVAVEEESLVRIEPNRPNAKSRRREINRSPIAQNGGM